MDLAGTWLGQDEAVLLLTVLTLATVGTTVLFLISLTATRRRQTRPYLLLTGAIGLLMVRSVVGIGTALGRVPMPVHHIAEHTSDFLIAVLVLAAIYSVGARFGAE
ncbi:hypothetical protein ACFQL1_22115 [Halomicroarcula sp. GCM10025709]|uniref:DUF7471 family protein n=1 Tax=Haloarcula TaxID=2237 RepID=UPI0024C2F77C|nr:hypothetical protein [Halomicroarcula sp. YJ-61-S]